MPLLTRKVDYLFQYLIDYMTIKIIQNDCPSPNISYVFIGCELVLSNAFPNAYV